MPDYRKIMDLLVQGHSYRQVQALAGCSHRAISKAKHVLDEQQFSTREQIRDLSAEELDRFFSDGRKQAASQFVAIDVEAVLKARIGRKKPPLKVLWARYLDTERTGDARFYGYERFCQIIAEQARVRNLTSALTHEPGHTMQVDWAGMKMQLVDPITGQLTKVSVFVASLPYSGMIFARGYLDEKLVSWCDAHRRAFEYVQGVAQVIVPDNASTASNVISRYAKVREVNQSYAQFLEHYQSAAVPTDPYKPQQKGNVESGVRQVTNWVIHYLAEHRFSALDELNEAVAERVDWLNDRTPFRNEPRSRRRWFEEHEQQTLMGLPDQPWQPVDWRRAKVSRDWHVQVDTVKYSVPHNYAGRQLDVRIMGEKVAVLADGQIIAEHRRGARKHAYVTDPQHAPAGYEDTSLLWTRAYFLRQGAKVGPYTERALGRLLDAKKIEAQGYRSCMNILGLGKGNNRALLERACHDAWISDERAVPSYTALKHRISILRAAQNQRPTTTGSLLELPSVPAEAVAGPRDTRGAYLGGISQFSLDALTGNSGAGKPAQDLDQEGSQDA